MIDKNTSLFSGGSITYNATWEIQSNLSIRQYYAAKAMQAFIGSEGHTSGKGGVVKYSLDAISQYSFQVADAMIEFENKERE